MLQTVMMWPWPFAVIRSIAVQVPVMVPSRLTSTMSRCC